MSAITSLVWFMLSLVPGRSMDDWLFRYQLADAITSVTDDEHEQRLLAKIASQESNYVRRIAQCRCRKDECDGGRAKGVFQVIPRNRVEHEQLCVSLESDVRLALERVRESVRACGNGPSGLAVYARGRCDSTDGRRLSRQRWVD